MAQGKYALFYVKKMHIYILLRNMGRKALVLKGIIFLLCFSNTSVIRLLLELIDN